jgi:release factor glutamine methyltransferase
VRLVIPPGVLTPPSDASMLADVLRAHAPGADVLDVGTGSGVIAISAALAGARTVTAVDVSRRAVLTARLNARLNGTRVRALRGDLLAPVAGERFDVVVSNPPYLPSPDDDLPRAGLARATEAGRDGRVLLDRLIAAAPAHLRPGGRLLVVHSSLNGTEKTLFRMRDAGLSPDVAARRHGRLGPILSARTELLEERGLLAPGQREEELVVVSGAAA